MSAASRNEHFAVKMERSSHVQALPSVLLGLLAPMLLFLLADLADASIVAYVYLVAIFVIASAAYLISIFETLESTSMIADQHRQLITVEKTGLLARKSIEIPFSNVTTVRMETRYDDDGYYTSLPILVLTSRETVQLPTGTTDSDIATLRTMLHQAR